MGLTRSRAPGTGSAIDSARGVTSPPAVAETGEEADKLNTEVRELLEDIVEHIDGIPEERLIEFDCDPHPPSVFSTLSDRAHDILSALPPPPQGKERE